MSRNAHLVELRDLEVQDFFGHVPRRIPVYTVPGVAIAPDDACNAEGAFDKVPRLVQADVLGVRLLARRRALVLGLRHGFLDFLLLLAFSILSASAFSFI